jgi:outer membrane protein TolC
LQEIAQLKQDLSYLTGIPEGALSVDTGLLQYQNVLDQSLQNNDIDTLNNPLVDYYNKQKGVYQSQEKFIKKSYLPKLLLAGGAWGRGSSIDYSDNYQSLSTGLGYQRFNYGIGLAFNYNLFDMIHRHDKLAVNKYKMQQSDYELQEQQLQLRTASGKALAALSAIDKNRKEIPLQIASATDLYHQKLAQYQAGVSNLVDLTNAAYLLLEAQTANIQIVTDWYLAKLDKAAADGNLSQFIQSIK